MRLWRVPKVLLGIFFLCGTSVFAAAPDSDEVLQLAVDAGEWLKAQGQTQSAGVAWPGDAKQSGTVSYDLGSGTSGIVVFYLSLYEATGDARYLGLAEEGGAYLASLLDDPELFGDGARRTGLYAGIAGVGVALELLAEYRPAFSADVDKVVALLDDWKVVESAGTRWSDDFNDLLYGDSGTILFLAWRAQRDGDERAMQLAVSASQYMLTMADEAESGHYWRYRRGKPFNLPGFSHGTAGVAYVLGTVGVLADEPSLRAAAAEGFAYIQSIAEIEDGLIRIPYGWPAEQWEGLFDFGWAHGLAGSNALFVRLQQLGIEEREAARYKGLVVGTLANIGLSGTPIAPYAEPSLALDWRFGRASVLGLLSDYDAGLETRDGIWGVIVEQATRADGLAYWEVEAPAFMGGGNAAFTGYFHGAAGIGLALLRMHAAMTERPPYVTMPDDPFAWTE
ncbi:MAG: lanthionine synthetase LanC family protein [Woeseiaceae bacterium]